MHFYPENAILSYLVERGWPLGLGLAGDFDPRILLSCTYPDSLSSEECRGRKLKCDEQKPICERCRKSGKECHSGNNLFRYDQNASLNGIGAVALKNELKKYYKDKQSFGADVIWVDIPKQCMT